MQLSMSALHASSYMPLHYEHRTEEASTFKEASEPVDVVPIQLNTDA